MNIGVGRQIVPDEDFEIMFESLSATDKSDTSSVDMIFKALIDEMIDSATSLEERNTVFDDLFVESCNDKNKTVKSEDGSLKTESTRAGDAETQTGDEGKVDEKELKKEDVNTPEVEASGDVDLVRRLKGVIENELEVGRFQLPMFDQHHQELELGVGDSYSSCVARWAEARREGGK